MNGMTAVASDSDVWGWVPIHRIGLEACVLVAAGSFGGGITLWCVHAFGLAYDTCRLVMCLLDCCSMFP